MSDHETAEHSSAAEPSNPRVHGTSKVMIAMMLGCLVIGVVGVFYRSFYLDLAFVLTMGFCVGHHLWHRYRHRRHAAEELQ